MISNTHRFRSIGWIALLAICAALVMILAFRVNALRSQVHRTEVKIVALRQEQMYLETEFETRANQQQLKAWNDVEFGFVAPGAGQYLENERQLAMLAKPADPGAPAPIRVASTDDRVAAQAAFPQMVSPLTGKAASADVAADPKPAADHAAATAGLGARLARVDHAGDEKRPAKGAKAAKPEVKLAVKGKAASGKTVPGKAAPTKVAAAKALSPKSTSTRAASSKGPMSKAAAIKVAADRDTPAKATPGKAARTFLVAGRGAKSPT